MSAVTSFLSESVVESLKGAYKLRKSYQLYHRIFDMIIATDGTKTIDSTEDTKIPALEEKLLEDSDDELADAVDDTNPAALSKSIERMNISNGTTRSGLDLEKMPTSSDVRRPSLSNTPQTSPPSPNIDRRSSIATFSTDYEIPAPQPDMTVTDQAIYGGTLMALGAIMLLISLLPPSLSRLLSIIGFRGSRSQALSMLWKGASLPGPFGGLSTFALGGYYGNIVQVSDIVSDEFSTRGSGGGTTLEKLHAAVTNVRRRYPNSALWAVEEVFTLMT